MPSSGSETKNQDKSKGLGPPRSLRPSHPDFWGEKRGLFVSRSPWGFQWRVRVLNQRQMGCYCPCHCLQLSSVTQSCPTLWLHGLQNASLPCTSPTPGACSNSCPSSPLLYLPAILTPREGSWGWARREDACHQLQGAPRAAATLPHHRLHPPLWREGCKVPHTLQREPRRGCHTPARLAGNNQYLGLRSPQLPNYNPSQNP